MKKLDSPVVIIINPDIGTIDRIFKNGTRRNDCDYAGGKGYRHISISGVLRYSHRLIWEYVNGEIPCGMFIDHINGCASDNRISNLKLVTPAQNTENRHKVSSRNKSSGVNGVYFDKKNNRYCAHIISKGIKYKLGRYATCDEAAAAYNEAAAHFHTHNPCALLAKSALAVQA